MGSRGLQHKLRKLTCALVFLGAVGIQFTLGLQPQTPEQAVVRVAPLEPRQPPATGFLISPDGYLLTAAHVVCGSTKFRVRLEGDASPRDDPQQWREASLVPIKDVPNPLISRDLALLKIEGQQLPFLRLGDSDQVRRGDAIKAIGYPSTLGGIQATTQGRVTNTGASRNLPICDGNPELKNLIVTDVPITQGNSGGPLLRRNERTGEEEVIGIVNGIAALALATPINAALEDFLPRQALPAYQPQITTLEFPKEFFQGQKVEGQVGFWDANKDVAFAFVEVVELGGRTPVSVQQCCPQVFGKLSGEIRFTIEIPVTPSAPEQLTLRVTLLDLAGNQSKPEEQRFRARLPKPEIIEIDFPSEIRADRQPNLGTVKFKDPNADVELARFDRVEGPFEPFVINLRERGLFGKSEGIIDFTIRAQEAGRVTVRVTLIDAKGLRSEPKEFSFTAQPVGPPVLRVEPDRLDFSATAGGPNPSPKNLTITNAGSGTLNWTARVVNAPWLALSATRGTAPSTITASVNIAGLAAGSFSGLIVIEAPGAQNSPVAVPVTLELQRPADRTPPRTQASLSPQPNANGWHNSDVTVTLWAEDEPGGSGVKEICWQLSGATRGAFRCQEGSSVAFTVYSEGTTTVEYQARDNAGNEERKQSLEVRLDKTPPTITYTLSPQPNAQGWNNTDVTVRFNCQDTLSGLVSCTPQEERVTSEGERRIEGRAEDRAGNVRTTSVTVRLDKTPPRVSCQPPDTTRWYREDVSVPCTASDSLSGLANSVDASFTLIARGEGRAVSTGTRTVADRAGNSVTAGPYTFQIDKTPPTITAEPERSPDSNGWYNREVTVRFRCSDALSGVAICSSPMTVTREGRDQAVEGESVDKAGNRATATARVSLDKTPPTGSLTINDGAATTTETTVTLKIQANDNLSGVAQMRFSNDGRTWSDWEGFQSTRSWDLTRFGGSSSSGLKTVYAQLRDRAGNVSQTFSATIRLTVTTLSGHTDEVNSVAFSPDGRLLASGSADYTIKLWDVASGSLVRTLTGHTDYVLSVAFSPDGRLLASGSDDKTIKLWDISDLAGR
jgi:hypothetical protein